ncbi:MAG: valine--tRNA ligase [Candidatus Pacebacteria bacterium]|nr:valine--tRNA ligase [Candidatus Paceibacterota bacterium]
MEINEKFLKPYNPKDTEDKIYKLWEESGFFNPDICVEKGIIKDDAPAFSIVLPPPNVTGNLHTGHALMLVIEDILVRYKRMQGYKTLWLPGTDHAAIATQSKVEKILEKEKIRKADLGREEFLKRVKEFADNSHDQIVNQTKKMGASLDWSREAFTLDEKRSLAVRTAFKKMYDEGLIYRGYRIVNWDPKGQTTISDDEIVNEERKAKLYTFKYSTDFPISISTTRPETKVGDVAVAVNPNDERYREYIGREYDLEFCGVPIHIKIIADDVVEKDFGTGALGVTPAHSQTDWEIANRHNLEVKPVINEFAKMTVGGENILNKKTTEAREVIVTWLKEQNLLEKEEEINQNVPTAERTGGIIEPLPKLQWFINVNKPIPSRENLPTGQAGKSLKELMLEPLEKEEIKILPDRFVKVYYHWIENLRDWCISRQIWYGHQIPVWYPSTGSGQVYCDINPPADLENWEQDPDTLDTWFSSGLWTFSTLGWPEETKDLKTFHPTNVIETGHDILFFWIARMILMSKYLLGVNPFETIYLHGMVRSADGKKMSKSLGEKAIDPLTIIEKYGNDPLRMAMIVGNTPGNDLKLDENDIRGYGKFANKIWNATRFVLEQTSSLDKDNINLELLDEEDKKSNEELENLIKEITREMNEYRFSIVADKVYHYFWHTFADILIERSKEKIKNNTNSESAKILLYTHLITLLKIMHPFMPFITEEIWQNIHKQEKDKLLMVEKWPAYALASSGKPI